MYYERENYIITKKNIILLVLVSLLANSNIKTE